MKPLEGSHTGQGKKRVYLHMEALVCLPLFYLRPGAASLHDLNTIHSTNEKFTPNIHYAYECTLCGVDFSNNI